MVAAGRRRTRTAAVVGFSGNAFGLRLSSYHFGLP